MRTMPSKFSTKCIHIIVPELNGTCAAESSIFPVQAPSVIFNGKKRSVQASKIYFFEENNVLQAKL